MKYFIFLALIFASANLSLVKSQVSQSQSQSPSSAATSSGHYNNYYNPYYSGLNYNQLGNQKQDLFTNLLTNNNNANNPTDLSNNGVDGSEIGEIGTSVVAAIIAALGIKAVVKLGLYLVGFFVFFIILLLVPTALGIAAVALAATQNNDNNNNNNNNNNKGGGLMNMFKQMWGKDDGRGIETFNIFLNSEECVERISCSISQKTQGIFYGLKQEQPSHKIIEVSSTSTSATTDSGSLKEESKRNFSNRRGRNNGQVKAGMMQRISRGLKEKNCKAYKCSVMPSFF